MYTFKHSGQAGKGGVFRGRAFVYTVGDFKLTSRNHVMESQQLPKIRTFTTEQLDGIIANATAEGKPAGKWAEDMLKTIAILLGKDPAQYLSFGPMWWPIKGLLQERGMLGGKPADDALVEQASFGSDVYDVAAAFAFHTHYRGGSAFTVEDENGDVIDYELTDDDMAG